MADAEHWIRSLDLAPHPEGGWYREIYRSAESLPAAALPPRFGGERRFSTAIYYLLDTSSFSAFHRIHQDEVWHLYDGGPLTIHTIDAAGVYATHEVAPVTVVPAGVLFGATTPGYALAGCTVAPGFEFADFEMPGRAALLESYPQHRAIIERLTRPA